MSLSHLSDRLHQRLPSLAGVFHSGPKLHRQQLDVVEDIDGRFLRQALEYVSGERGFSAPSREHLLALFAYAESFRKSCDERDLLIEALHARIDVLLGKLQDVPRR